MAIDQDFALDRPLLKRRFERAAATYDEVAVLAREVGRRMDERLDYIRVQPKRVLDLGCGTGADLEMLGKRFPTAQRVGADLALPMLARARGERGLFDRLRAFGRTQRSEFACTDAAALPFARASMSLVWSNLMLNWLSDPLPALKEIHRVLEVDGMLMFSTFGPDTLRELRAVLPTKGGERVHRFIDMHDLGDALVQAGFTDPVMDMEMVTMTYSSVDELLRDLRLAGCANASTARPRGLSGRTGWAGARRALEALRRDGRLPASFEVVQGHAWKAQPKTTEDGRSVIRFQPKPGGR
ncbi:MAG TPA: methyltransferase domain-containing protein [Aromatoleum sp.]|uniref:methyltransferase domain-containing protein n=1 Tax=Aromatoleum sp. TaxID=2307007 RepID=UPI002B49F8FF|nr:methyltransferase domain-containing protein [Aromatoleum sp.]HJV28476.1 methyltransferase domain-containing protein [Aromatoleum sp.]